MGQEIKPPEGYEDVDLVASAPEGYEEIEAQGLPPAPEGYGEPVQDKGLPQQAAETLLDNQFTQGHSWWSPTRIASTAAGSIAAAAAGVSQAGRSIAQTGEVLAGEQNPVPLNRESDFQQPLDWGDVNPFKLAPKVTYMMGESSPMIAGGVGGELVGAVGGPLGAAAGGMAGSAAASAAQQYGPVYADMRAQGRTHEEAQRVAATSSGISALFGGLSYGIFRRPLAENAATNLALQMTVAQPLTSGGEMAAQNVFAFEQPWHEGVGSAAAAGIVTGGAMELGTRAFLPRKYSPDPTQPVENEDGPTSPPPVPPMEGEVLGPEGVPPDVPPPPPAGYIDDAASSARDVSPEAMVDARLQNIPEFIRDRVKAKIKGNMEEPAEVPPEAMLQNPNTDPETFRQNPGANTPPITNRTEIGVAGEEYLRQGTANDPDAYTGELNRQRSQSLQSGTDFLMKAFQKEDGASEIFENVYAKYKERAGKNALGQPEFRNMIRDYGYRIDKIAGASRVIGVKLRDVPPTETQGNVTAFPGTKFPRGPSEAIAQMVESDASARIADRIEPIDTRKDPMQTNKLNQEIEQLRMKWDDRVNARKTQARAQDRRGGYIERLPNGRVRLLSGTDLETKLAQQGNLADPLKTEYVDPNSLDANQVMADPRDMPIDASDPRIFRRGNLRLEEIQTLLDRSETGYEALISAGVRVAPSRGSSYTYLGDVKGTKIGVMPQSGRSDHVINYNRPGELAQYPKDAHHEITAFDYNKIDPKEYFVSLDVEKLSGDPSVGMAVVMHNQPKLMELAKAGKLPPVTIGPNGRIVDQKIMLVKPLPRTALLDSYRGPGQAQRTPVDFSGVPLKYGTGQLVVVEPFKGTLADPVVQSMVKEIKDTVQDVYPAFAKVFERFGAKSDFDIIIEAYPKGHPLTFDSSPRIHWHENKIVLSTNWIDAEGVFVGDKRSQTIQILAHEMGHAFDHRVWKNLSQDVRNEVYGAYRRELARQGIQHDLSSYQTVLDPNGKLAQGNVTYHLHFQEWMAEQFRRFISADRRFNQDLAKFFGKGADSMSALMDTYKRIEGPYKMKQRFTPSFEFQKLADYVEAMARTGDSIIDMKIISDVMKYDWSPPDHTAINDTLQAIRNEIENLKEIFTIDSSLELDTTIPNIDEITEFGSHMGGMIRLMVGSLAWVKGAENRAVAVRRTMIHEAFHGVARMLSDGQIELLAKAADLAKVFTKADEARYRQYINKELDRTSSHVDLYDREVLFRRKLNEEKAAFYMEGVRTETIPVEAISLAGKLRDFFRRVANLMMSRGYNTHEDLVRSFFRGELTKRYNAKVRRQQKRGNPFDFKTVETGIKDLGDGFYGNVKHDETSDTTTYSMVGRDGKPVGYLLIEHKADGPYVDMIEIGDVGAMRRMVREGKGRLSDRLIDWAEEHMGVKIKSPQEYTKAGYKMALKRDPALVHGYTLVNGLYMSPKYIRDHYNKTLEILAEAKADKWDTQSLKFAESSVRTWKQRFDKIPQDVFNDPSMHKQWSLREFELSGYEKARIAGQAEMLEDITGIPAPKDPFMEVDAQLREIEQKFNAGKTGYQYGAEPQIEMKSMRDWLRNANPDKETAKAVSGQIAQGDKMWKVAKGWYTMRQMSHMNPTIGWLRNYVSLREQESQRKMYHVSKADHIVKNWEKRLHPKQADNLSKLLFWATEMKYLTPAERAAKVSRHPLRSEVLKEARRLGLGREAVDVYDSIIDPQKGHLAEYLRDVERVTAENYQRLYKNNPQGLQTALNRLAADMNKMRSRPYFPMSRFGSYAMIIKDAYGKTQHFETFETRKARDAAMREAAKKYPQDHVHADVIPEDARSFQGIPKPLLDQMMNDPTLNLSPAQRDWMQDFTARAAPETSFRKRWLEREGTPGYSLDGMRAYADYFRRGSGYLARLEFRDALAENRGFAVQDIASLGWKDGRRMMLDMIDNHSEWMDKPGKDWVKLKTLATNWYLGASVAAAATNLTQPVIFTAPYLGSLFGYAGAGKKMTHVADAISRVRGDGYVNPKLGKDFAEGHAEMVEQGIIETGQAAELGVFADSNNLDKSLVGSNAQKAWRKTTEVSMWMFGKTERFNRELTFRAAFELAMENPRAKHVQDVAKWYAREIIDLEARRPNISPEAAIATYVAKEAIQRTQFVYDSWDRPRFMRSGFMNSLAVFISYPHQVLFSLRHNPGAAVSALLMLGLGGTMGMPGAEDLDNALNLVARKVFGKDFSLKRLQKEFMKHLFVGEQNATLAADLLLHGISKYGYGLGLLPEGWGVPRFDASASHSMGELVPGLSPLMKGMANNTLDADGWKNTISDTVRDMAGAGYGPYFSMMQLMHANPGTDDWKTWEQALPRSIKAMSKAARYTFQEQEKNRNGAKIAEFDMSNPDDKATVIAQFLGFTPKKLTDKYTADQEYYSRLNYYKARQLNFIMDYKSAEDTGNAEAKAQVISNIRAYNEELKAEGLSTMQITADTIKRSLQARERAKARTEAGLPQQKKYQQLWDQTHGPREIDERVR